MGGLASVLWGLASVLWGDNINIVEVAQYSGDKDAKYYESSLRFAIRSTTSQASSVDHS